MELTQLPTAAVKAVRASAVDGSGCSLGDSGRGQRGGARLQVGVWLGDNEADWVTPGGATASGRFLLCRSQK